MTASLAQKAAQLAQLHSSGELIVLPTVWDVWSAKIAAEAGFPGLTIGSHPVADSLGESDGEKMDFAEYLAVIERITESVDLPVSADVESGYGLAPEDLYERVLGAGAVGVNIEDTVHVEGDRVRDISEQADYIAAIRAAADAAGVEFVINGRTDAFIHSDDYADPLAEAVARIQAMAQAGARSVYPVRAPSAEAVRTLVEAVDVPVNVTAHPVDGHVAGDLAAIRDLGVRRITFGPLWQMALGKLAAQQLSAWQS